MDALVCMNKTRFCFTIESLPFQCQLHLLLPSPAGGFPSIWRGCVVSVYSLSFISLPLGSDPDHAVPSFTVDEFGAFCSCALQGYPPQPVTNHMSGMGAKPCCREAQLLPGPACLLIMDNPFSHGLLPPLPASDSVDLKICKHLSFAWVLAGAAAPLSAQASIPARQSLGCTAWICHIAKSGSNSSPCLNKSHPDFAVSYFSVLLCKLKAAA